MGRHKPSRNFRLRLEIDSIERAAFSEVTIGEPASDPMEYRKGDEIPTVRKRSHEVRQRHAQVRDHRLGRACLVAPAHHRRRDPALRDPQDRRHPGPGRSRQRQGGVRGHSAWPCKYDPTDLNDTGNEVAIDTLEFCNEGIRRI
jgi:hypothetical protein